VGRRLVAKDRRFEAKPPSAALRAAVRVGLGAYAALGFRG